MSALPGRALPLADTPSQMVDTLSEPAGTMSASPDRALPLEDTPSQKEDIQ